MASSNRSEKQAQDAQVILGIEKNMLAVPTVSLDGKPTTPADLVKLVQSRIDAANAIEPERARWMAAVQAYRALDRQVTLAVRALRVNVINVYGPTSTVLADFGFSPPKVTEKSPAVKVAAAVKGVATRKARGTLGKNQKKGIKGTVGAG